MKTAPQLSAYSIDAIVKGVANGDFSGIREILPRLSLPEMEILSDFLIELYDSKESTTPLMDFSTQLSMEQSSNEQDMVAVFATGFNTALNMRLIFGDLGLKYFKSFIVPFYKDVEAEADSIQIDSEEGKKRITSMIGAMIKRYISSADDVPLYIRQSLLSLHKSMGKGEGPLDLAIATCMGIIGEYCISKDAVIKYFQDPSEKVSKLLKECGTLWTAIAFQIPQENEIYSQFITKFVPQLNEFIEEVYDEKLLQIASKILSSATITDEDRQTKALYRLKDFLSSLDESESTDSEFEMSYDNMQELLETLDSKKWKMAFYENGFTFYTKEEKDNTICVRVDGMVHSKLKDAALHFQQNIFATRHFSDFQIQSISDDFYTISVQHNYPFPFTNRYLNLNSYIWSDEKEAYCIFTDRSGKTPEGLVRSHINLCGAHIKTSQHPHFVDVSMVMHIDPNGNLPNWVLERNQKPIMKSMTKLFEAMEGTKTKLSIRSQSSDQLRPSNGEPRRVPSGNNVHHTPWDERL